MSESAIVVCCAIIRKGTRFLIARRSEGHLKGKWEFPGGKVEEDETPEEALEREIHEEFLVRIKVGQRLSTSVFDYGTKVVELIPFVAEIVSGDLRPQDHDAVEWIGVDDFEKFDIAPADVPIVSEVARIFKKG